MLYSMDVTDEENDLLWDMEKSSVEVTLRAAKLTQNTQNVQIEPIKDDLCKMIAATDKFFGAYTSLLDVRKNAKK